MFEHSLGPIVPQVHEMLVLEGYILVQSWGKQLYPQICEIMSDNIGNEAESNILG